MGSVRAAGCRDGRSTIVPSAEGAGVDFQHIWEVVCISFAGQF